MMRYFLTLLSSFLRCRLVRWKTWLLFLLMPGIALAVHFFPAAEPTAPVTVGVVLPSVGAEDFWSLLESQNNDLLAFVQTDEQTLDRNVAAGRWDCGLVLPEDFEERIGQLDMDRLITVRIGAGSAVYPLVQESLSSCLAQLATPVIAWNYLVENRIVGEGDYAGMEAHLNRLRSETKTVGIQLVTNRGLPLSVPRILEAGSRQVLYWFIFALILLRVLFASADLCRFATSDAVRRLQSIRGQLLPVAARACADSLLILISGCLGIGMLGGGIWGCAAVCCCALFWMSLSVFLAGFSGIHTAMIAFVPFVPAISFLLSSVAVDLSAVLPGMAGFLQNVPVALFLRICGGDWTALAVQIGLTAVCWLAAFAAERFRL